MKLHLPDWKLAFIGALAFLGIAAFVLFIIHPGGFEGQLAWFFGLLPGTIVGAALGDRLYSVTPLGEVIVYWSSVICLSFLWYFAISYALIRAFRFTSRIF